MGEMKPSAPYRMSRAGPLRALPVPLSMCFCPMYNAQSEKTDLSASPHRTPVSTGWHHSPE